MKKLIKINLKQKFALTVCVVLLFILCRPLVQLVTFENAKRFSEPYMVISTMEDFFLPSIFCDFLPTLASSGIIALVFFSYLFSKKRVDLYHSIPVDRKRLFTVNYISGVIVYVVALLIEFIIGIFMAIPNHYMTGTVLCNIIASIFINLVHFLFGYSVTIFTIMLTGNIVVAVLGAMTISLFQPIVISLLNYFTRSMYVTYLECNVMKEDLVTKLYWLSPVTSYATIITRLENKWDVVAYSVKLKRLLNLLDYGPNTQVKSVYLALIMPMVMVVLITVAAYFMYLARPSEAAGKTIAFKKSEPFIRIPLVVTGGFIGAWFIMGSVNGFRTKWIWLGVILGVVLVHCLLEIIFKESFKALFSNRIQLVVSLAVTSIIIGIFLGDLTGQDKYLPKRENIKSASVYFEGIDNNLSCISVYEDPDNPGYFLTSYSGSNNYHLTKQTEDGAFIDKIYELSQIGVSVVDDMIAERYESDNDEIMYAEAYNEKWAYDDKIMGIEDEADEKSELSDISPEDAYAQAKQWMDENGIVEKEHGTSERKITIDICYTLTSGKRVLRQYNIPLSKALSAINEVYSTDEFNRNHFDIYDAIDKGAIKKADVYDIFDSRAVTFTDEDCKKFLEVYLKDLSALTIDKISEYPIGRISPSFKTAAGFDEIFSGYYIYPSFTNTLNYLKSIGVNTTDFTTEIKADKVSSIFVGSYDLYKYEDGNTLSLEELVYSADEDKDVIAELIPNMINASNMWSNEILYNRSEDGFGADVSVYFMSDKGLQRQTTVMYKDGKLPERIKQDIAVGIWRQNK